MAQAGHALGDRELPSQHGGCFFRAVRRNATGTEQHGEQQRHARSGLGRRAGSSASRWTRRPGITPLHLAGVIGSRSVPGNAVLVSEASPALRLDETAPGGRRTRSPWGAKNGGPVFRRVSCPHLAVARRRGTVLTWARALGEFGARSLSPATSRGGPRPMPLRSTQPELGQDGRGDSSEHGACRGQLVVRIFRRRIPAATDPPCSNADIQLRLSRPTWLRLAQWHQSGFLP